MASVLLVDDDRALRKLLRAYLEQESIAVVEAGSGEEALALIARAAPTLVLLDVRLPGLDGFEVLRRLEAGGTSVPVILVTSVGDEHSRRGSAHARRASRAPSAARSSSSTRRTGRWSTRRRCR